MPLAAKKMEIFCRRWFKATLKYAIHLGEELRCCLVGWGKVIEGCVEITFNCEERKWESEVFLYGWSALQIKTN